MANPLFEKFGMSKKKGEIIFCEFEPGTTLFFLQAGNVRITKIVSGTEKTLALIKPGDIFGEMAILEKMPRSATAISETATELLELDQKSFFALVQSQPSLGIKLLKIFALRINDQKRKLKILNRKNNSMKILDTFIMLHEKTHGSMINDNDFQLKTTIRDLGSWAGLSEKVAETTLQSLRQSNYVEYEDNETFTVKNLEHLKTIVNRKVE